MVNTKEIAAEYVSACIEQADKEQRLAEAFQAFSWYNEVFGLADSVKTPYRELIQDLVGHSTAEHLEWWIATASPEHTYDATVNIDGKSYRRKNLTWDKFWELIFS